MAPLHELDEAHFDRVMDVNVRGTWNCPRAQIPVMPAAGGSAGGTPSAVSGSTPSWWARPVPR
ncbi:hypothetical protein [Streptomyces canus]|uniref:hypothetical protein n=1 Tax=Streptomyces canus TaxID=58343 RepID=UPI0027D83530|nr:hypothetical protein [Streptomyces canus]